MRLPSRRVALPLLGRSEHTDTRGGRRGRRDRPRAVREGNRSHRDRTARRDGWSGKPAADLRGRAVQGSVGRAEGRRDGAARAVEARLLEVESMRAGRVAACAVLLAACACTSSGSSPSPAASVAHTGAQGVDTATCDRDQRFLSEVDTEYANVTSGFNKTVNGATLAKAQTAVH